MLSLAVELYYDIVRTCAIALSREFKEGILARSYATPEEFRTCVMVNIEGMNVLGDVECSAVLVPGQGAYLEAVGRALCGASF